MSILVGFTNSLGGQDALALGTVLARTLSQPLDLAMILPATNEVTRLAPPSAGYENLLVDQAEGWLTEAVAASPADVTARPQLRYAEYFSDGLVEAAEELDARALVIGAGRHGALGQVSLGSVGDSLLHSASIPVGLAPRGFRHSPPDRFKRVTVMVGKRVGNKRLREEAVRFALDSGAEVRLVSLVALDNQDSATAKAHAQKLLDDTLSELPDGASAVAEVASGHRIDDAVANLEWRADELAMVGSSRLAQPRRLFLGSTANKLLRALPVPLIAVPRGDLEVKG